MLIAGPNLLVARTIRLAELRPGEVLRARSAQSGPGGKAENVARTALALGSAAELVAFVPRGRSGQTMAGWLADDGVPLIGVPIDGEVRSAAIVIEDSGRTTVVNEPGPAAGERAWEEYQEQVASRLAHHGVLCCCGSTPPGGARRGYAELVRSAHAGSVTTIIDASSDVLAATLEAGPRLVTPNLAEAEEVLTGRAVHTVATDALTARRRGLDAAAALVEHGARAAVVTAGAAGLAIAARDEEPGWLEAPPVSVRNEIGAGDALVAGLACALERGTAFQDAVLTGMAAAGAAVEEELPGRIDPQRVAELERELRQVG